METKGQSGIKVRRRGLQGKGKCKRLQKSRMRKEREIRKIPVRNKKEPTADDPSRGRNFLNVSINYNNNAFVDA